MKAKPLPPSIISISALMCILLSIYLVFLILVYNVLLANNAASIDSFFLWAFWSFVILFAGGALTHQYYQNKITLRICPKCGAYGLWRALHLVDAHLVPAMLDREERHYDSRGNFIGTTRSQYEGKELQYIIEPACYCPYCNESWYENRCKIMSPLPEGRLYVKDLEHLIRFAKAQEHDPDLA